MKKAPILLLLISLSTSLIAQEKHSSSILISEAPESYQLYPRRQDNSSEVVLAGKFENKKYNGALMLKVFKDGILFETKEKRTEDSSFRFSSIIKAGLHQYAFQLFKIKNVESELLFSADSVVCGDAYIITGQSNSHPSSSDVIYSNPYCRSFGVKTGYEVYSDEDRKVRWGMATGNCPDLKGVGGWFTKNSFGVGVWGMELMKLIVEKHKIPVCFINGGSGSSSIEENMLYPEKPSLETSFGRLAYRVDQAGLKDKVKAIFWHQGETNSDDRYQTYAANFDILLNDWKGVYTGLEKIYLFQLHPGCGGNFQSEMRETQSRIAKNQELVTIMSTTGVIGHDGCHFSHEGYNEFAHRIFPVVSRDFYGEEFDTTITPPRLLKAFYRNSQELVLEFDQPVVVEENHQVNGKTYLMKDQFFFRSEPDNKPESGLVEKIIVEDSYLILELEGEMPYSYISWLPGKNYRNTEICYEGPWIRGSLNDLGALTFDRRTVIPPTDSRSDEVAKWNGYDMLDSTLNEVPFKLVFPKKANEKRHWIWRARFWGHEPQTDIALLEQGFHVAYIEVGGLFGNEHAIEIWNEFYEVMIQKYGLNKKAALEGMSRGGLIIFNWGNRNAEKVACIYGDAPVCDFKSWPGGKGIGKGSSQDWDACLEQYGFNEKIAMNFNGNPVDHMENLAKNQVPILHVVGDADKVVPVLENTAALEKRLKDLGWQMEIIHKPAIGHHPHSLKDPTPIVDFILKSVGQ